jgi:hypothetical protein
MTTQGQKRSADDDSTNARKKTRGNEHDDTAQNGYPVLVSMNPALPANNMYARPPHDNSPNNLFSDLMRGGNGSPMFASPTTNPSPAGFGNGSQSNYQSSYMPGVNMGVDSPLPPLSFSPSSGVPAVQSSMQPQQQGNQLSPEQADDDDDPNKSEAYKLIQ